MSRHQVMKIAQRSATAFLLGETDGGRHRGPTQAQSRARSDPGERLGRCRAGSSAGTRSLGNKTPARAAGLERRAMKCATQLDMATQGGC